MNNFKEHSAQIEHATTSSSKELLPVDRIVARFEHLGRDFSVINKTLIPRMNYSEYSILDENNNSQGYILGTHRTIGEKEAFTPVSSENKSKRNGESIPKLVLTAIGEIVLQSKYPLTWQSSINLLSDGKRMYDSLRIELDQEGTRFFGKLRMYRSVADNDGRPVVRCSIQKIKS